MSRSLIVACLILLATSLASAEQIQTIDQRIAAQIGALVLRNAAQEQQIDVLQKQLADAQAKIKQLEDAARKVPEQAKPAQ